MIFLCTDLHLDAKQQNSYRWNVFDEIARVYRKFGFSAVYCLGDAVDARDYHSAALVNRFVSAWTQVPVPKVILRGNHDTLLGGGSFWDFLGEIEGLKYVSAPFVDGAKLFLPFSLRPEADWKGLRMRDHRAIFIHQTVTGAIAENGRALAGLDREHLLPRSGVRIYSGDVHVPQTVGNVVYVGASHHVHFGDRFSPRFLLIDEDAFDVVEDVSVRTIARRMVDVASAGDLDDVETRPGDQVKVRVSAAPGADRDAFEAEVERWAIARGVTVVAIDGSTDLPTQSSAPTEDWSPADLLREFAAGEGMSGDLLDVGLELLKEVT